MQSEHPIIEWKLQFKNLKILKLIDLSHVLSPAKFLNQNAHRLIVQKPCRKRAHIKHRCRWDDNIKMDPKK
jgi:hypothetical protein